MARKPPTQHRARMQPTSAVVTAAVATGVFAVDRALHVPDLSNWDPLTSRKILKTSSLHLLDKQTETQVRGDPEALQDSARLSEQWGLYTEKEESRGSVWFRVPPSSA